MRAKRQNIVENRAVRAFVRAVIQSWPSRHNVVSMFLACHPGRRNRWDYFLFQVQYDNSY